MNGGLAGNMADMAPRAGRVGAGRVAAGHARAGTPGAVLTVGLVNNMPDAALARTERQFHALLAAAAGPRPLRVLPVALPGVPRGPAARAWLDRATPAAALARADLDLLVVTGTEPRAADLRDEPYWGALTGLLDWAEAARVPTVLSCLAAHAAVLHADGIARRRLTEKCFGVFTHTAARPHPLTRGLPARFAAPHSRWNEVAEADLAASGWQVLTRSASAGADLFVRERGGLTVCFQGHPEYEPDTLAREYRRDARRFLAGERPGYPAPPRGALAPGALPALAAFQARALAAPDPGLMAAFPPLAPRLEDGEAPWRAAAATIWRNLLSWVHMDAARHV